MKFKGLKQEAINLIKNSPITNFKKDLKLIENCAFYRNDYENGYHEYVQELSPDFLTLALKDNDGNIVQSSLWTINDL